MVADAQVAQYQIYPRKTALPELTTRIIVGTANTSKAELLGKTELHKLLVKSLSGMGEVGKGGPVPVLGSHEAQCTCVTHGFSPHNRTPKSPLKPMAGQVHGATASCN